MQATPWNSIDDGSRAQHFHIDMRAAYLSCDERTFRADSQAADFIKRYGFPLASTMRLARLDEEQPITVGSPVMQLTGAVQLSPWEFSQKAHDYTPWRVGIHLREHDGWITAPDLLEPRCRPGSAGRIQPWHESRSQVP